MRNIKIYKNLLVVALLGIVFILPFLSMQNFSPVFDEITHLPSGLSYLKTGEIKLNPQHPPLIKMIAAFPLLFLDLKFNPQDPHLVGPKTDEWQFGRDILFNNGVDDIMFWGRIPIILLSVLLGWYVFKWGKELFGYKTGIIGLFIYAFMPNIIAHSQFVTTDLGVTAFSFIAMYHLWKFTRQPNKKNIVLSGLTLGLALGSKFSAVFLLPASLFLLAVYIQKKYQNSSWSVKISELLKIIIPIWGLSFLFIWGLYLFPEDILFYWHGLNTVYADRNPDHFYYLNGSFNHAGWWYYFLWAFIIKTPVPFLVALGLALAYYKKQAISFLNSSFIFLPLILFLFITSWKAHDIGVRYILPVYPFLILFVSGYLSEKFRNSKLETINSNTKIKIQTILILVLAVWYIFSAINVYPNYLSYFNEIIGGSDNGYKYLDDSNIEWGQDLKRLAAYQKKNPALKVFLWTDSDAYRSYGIKNILPLNFQGDWLNPKGKYAVSVHVLIRTRLASQVYKNILLDWMDRYKPVDRIGQSFFIYEF